MRSIIVDAARAAQTDRRGGDAEQVTLDSELIGTLPAASDEILDVHAALEDLARIDERLGRVVEMRYFGGMEDAEIAEALGLSARTRAARLGQGSAAAGPRTANPTAQAPPG